MRSLALAFVGAISLSVSVAPGAFAADASAAFQPLFTKAARVAVTKASAARAQDTGLNGNYNWTGVYGGLNAGYLSGASRWTNVLPPASVTNTSVNQSMLGLHAGVQFNIRNSVPWGLVLGAELAYSSPTTSNRSAVACAFDPAQTCRTRFDSVLTAGGRLGLSYENFLLFGTGGYAQANVTTEQSGAAGACIGTVCDQARPRGWYAGAGLDYKLSKGDAADVILGIEWQHIELDTGRHVLLNGAVTANTRDVDASADIIRARLSLKFNPFNNGTITVGDYKIDW